MRKILLVLIFLFCVSFPVNAMLGKIWVEWEPYSAGEKWNSEINWVVLLQKNLYEGLWFGIQLDTVTSELSTAKIFPGRSFSPISTNFVWFFRYEYQELEFKFERFCLHYFGQSGIPYNNDFAGVRLSAKYNFGF